MTKLISIAVAVLAMALGGCGDDGDSGRAEDPAASAENRPMPTDPVIPEGEVTTRYAVTVMDTGRPELCLGAVAESYPPQCGGPAITGWDWSQHEGHYDQQGSVRWGEFRVTGTWDGTSFTASSAAPRGDAPEAVPDPPVPATSLSAAELERIAREVRELGGASGVYPTEAFVWVDVTYDDGSLQDWADEEYGTGVVAVISALIDA